MKTSISILKESLQNIYTDGEIEQIVYLVFNHIFGYSKIDLLLNKDKVLTSKEIESIQNIANQLKNHKPIQYILGCTEFYGLKFDINSNVLIPRQETEELVDWIIKENSSIPQGILDIGTGSGCIPISLAHNLPLSNISSFDISPQAIEVAQNNAKLNNTQVEFKEVDILNWESYNFSKKWNIIVSNPPYVKEIEKQEIADNVLQYEPYLALFVDDKDPLIFYRTIAQFALKHLAPKGKVYFEINQYHGHDMIDLMESLGFKNIILRKDLNGNDRMLSANL